MGVGYNSESKGLTRRQFLTYALGGTGAFMGVCVLGPLVTMAVDPLTRKDSSSSVSIGKASQFSDQYPTKVDFKLKQKDGWIEAENTYTAFVLKQSDGTYLAMSSVCTHLGCQVQQNIGADGHAAPFSGVVWFKCPCHGSQFSKTGIQQPGSPAQRPLDVYKATVDSSGNLMLGALKQRTV